MLVKIRPTHSNFCQKGITEFVSPSKMFISRGFKFIFGVFFKLCHIFTLYIFRNIVPEITCMRKKWLIEVRTIVFKGIYPPLDLKTCVLSMSSFGRQFLMRCLVSCRWIFWNLFSESRSQRFSIVSQPSSIFNLALLV